jgi:HSP20 family protein
MSNITRWNAFGSRSLLSSDPFGFVSLRNAMDRLFEDAFVSPGHLLTWSGSGDGGAVPASLDLCETEKDCVVTAALPGVRPEDIDVSVEGDFLTIKAETKAEEEKEKGGYHVRELRRGSFYRRVQLPVVVHADQAEARMENGMLMLRLPKAAEARERKIQITPSSASTKAETGKAA